MTAKPNPKSRVHEHEPKPEKSAVEKARKKVADATDAAVKKVKDNPGTAAAIAGGVAAAVAGAAVGASKLLGSGDKKPAAKKPAPGKSGSSASAKKA